MIVGGSALGPARAAPLYAWLADDMRGRIASGEWAQHSQIPTEAALSRLYGVSRITVRKAIDVLARAHLLNAQPGRGTFVMEPLVTAGERAWTSFTEEMAALGLGASSHVLQQEREFASAHVAKRLAIGQGDMVLHLVRVRLADEEPREIQSAWLPLKLVPGLDARPLGSQSLYEILRQHYGLEPTDADEVYEVKGLSEREAELLATRSGAPAFVVRRIGFTSTFPFEYVESVLRGDRYRVQVKRRSSPWPTSTS